MRDLNRLAPCAIDDYCGRCRKCDELDRYLRQHGPRYIWPEPAIEPRSYPRSSWPSLEAAMRLWGPPLRLTATGVRAIRGQA